MLPALSIFLFIIVYSYFIYPLLLLLLPIRRSIPEGIVKPADADLPTFTLIIAVHNEETRIARKLENALQIAYPVARLEVIVSSDCSTDRTESIVREFEEAGVRLVRCPERKGKEFAQLRGIEEARGDIVVFSDVGTDMTRESLKLLASAFLDAEIGAVSSEDTVVTPQDRSAGEGAYVRYEMWLRRLESQRAGLVGLSGSLFAVRIELCTDWDTESPSDFNTALSCARRGRVAVTMPLLRGIYQDIQDPKKEYERKVRTVLRGLSAVARHPEMLRPFLGVFAFQVWSHKIARWMVPFGLLGVLVTTLLLAASMAPGWIAIVAAQVTFYGIAALAHSIPTFQHDKIVRLIYFFVQVNIAVCHAMVYLIAGKRQINWTPSVR